MNQTERDLDKKVAEAVAKKHPHRNWALEVKTHKGKLKEHQKKALKQVENGKHPPQKIPDMGRRNPYDYYFLGDADAIVCVIQENKRDVQCTVNSGVFTFNIRI